VSVSEVGRMVMRHWLLMVLGVLVTAGLTTFAFVRVPPTYTSTGVVMLLQQSSSAVPGGENPYLVMDGSLGVTAAAVLRAVSDSPVMAQKVADIDPSGTFLITAVMEGPFLQVDTDASSPANTLAIQALAEEQMGETLTRLQAEVGAPSKLQIRLSQVSSPTKPKIVLKRKLQLVGGVLFGGLALTVSCGFLIDRLRPGSRRPASTVATRPPAEAFVFPPQPQQQAISYQPDMIFPPERSHPGNPRPHVVQEQQPVAYRPAPQPPASPARPGWLSVPTTPPPASPERPAAHDPQPTTPMRTGSVPALMPLPSGQRRNGVPSNGSNGVNGNGANGHSNGNRRPANIPSVNGNGSNGNSTNGNGTNGAQSPAGWTVSQERSRSQWTDTRASAEPNQAPANGRSAEAPDKPPTKAAPPPPTLPRGFAYPPAEDDPPTPRRPASTPGSH
jgi:hypothetical protein